MISQGNARCSCSLCVANGIICSMLASNWDLRSNWRTMSKLIGLTLSYHPELVKHSLQKRKLGHYCKCRGNPSSPSRGEAAWKWGRCAADERHENSKLHRKGAKKKKPTKNCFCSGTEERSNFSAETLKKKCNAPTLSFLLRIYCISPVVGRSTNVFGWSRSAAAWGGRRGQQVNALLDMKRLTWSSCRLEYTQTPRRKTRGGLQPRAFPPGGICGNHT